MEGNSASAILNLTLSLLFAFGFTQKDLSAMQAMVLFQWVPHGLLPIVGHSLAA